MMTNMLYWSKLSKVYGASDASQRSCSQRSCSQRSCSPQFERTFVSREYPNEHLRNRNALDKVDAATQTDDDWVTL